MKFSALPEGNNCFRHTPLGAHLAVVNNNAVTLHTKVIKKRKTPFVSESTHWREAAAPKASDMEALTQQ